MKYVLALGSIVALAACELPPLRVRYRITTGDAQQCSSTDCADIRVGCEPVLSLRIVPPGDPRVPYVSYCERLIGARGTLCGISSAELPAPTVPIPEQVLEVQMAVFPGDVVPLDPDTGKLVCPRVEYGANNLPLAVKPSCAPDEADCPVVPAIGGRAFYQPGDTETVVELGCTHIEQLDSLTCGGGRRLDVTATVNNFDDLVSSVDKQLAERLDVSVGEPTPSADSYILNITDPLVLSTTSTEPAWSAELDDVMYNSYVCIEVLEDGAQQTRSLTCRTAPGANDTTLDIAGIYLRKQTLDQVLAALSLTSFPIEGLVVGIVVDEFFNPLPNVAVNCGGCDIKYLDATRTGLVPNVTSASGIFVSQTAPFGTTFTIGSTMLPPVLGGLVEEKVTIVVIQERSVVGDNL